MKNPKLRGELAELRFLLKAASFGLVVSKPYGDSAPYDFIVDVGGRLLRVQVKSVASLDSGSYRVMTSHGGAHKRCYSPDELDFLAAYVAPARAWYIIPIVVFTQRKRLHLYPHRRTADRFSEFRNAWHLLR